MALYQAGDLGAFLKIAMPDWALRLDSGEPAQEGPAEEASGEQSRSGEIPLNCG